MIPVSKIETREVEHIRCTIVRKLGLYSCLTITSTKLLKQMATMKCILELALFYLQSGTVYIWEISAPALKP